jgi:hypothetical protein
MGLRLPPLVSEIALRAGIAQRRDRAEPLRCTLGRQMLFDQLTDSARVLSVMTVSIFKFRRCMSLPGNFSGTWSRNLPKYLFDPLVFV